MLNLKRIRKDQAGFTLVEIAIVMVIIGLLIGGVLKGQAMIQNAKVKRVVKQADEIRATVMSFFDKYGVYPGDENIANIPPGGGDAGGNQNGQMGNNVTERGDLFLDLSLAGLISGTYSGTNFPQHVFGGNVWLYWVNAPGAATPTTHYIRFFNLPADVALEIDMKYDDGVWNTGSMVANVNYTGANLVQFYDTF